MYKKMKNKILSLFMIIGMLIQIMIPTTVLATNYKDGNRIVIGGNPIVNGDKLQYSNGYIKIYKNNTNITTTTFNVVADDEITIELFANEGYEARLNEGDHNIELSSSIYTFKVGHADSNDISFNPIFMLSAPPIEIVTYDITINGESFTNVKDGDQITTSSNFNVNSLDELYVTKIVKTSGTYTYEPGEYSLNMLDAEGKKILESHFDKQSNNSALFRIESHNEDILDKDVKSGKTKNDYKGFYLVDVAFTKPEFAGVEIYTEHMPDFYDFTQWNGTDLSDTTINKPGEVTAYYGDNIINFSGVNKLISKIELVENKGVPTSAININNDDKIITVNSNYYNEIPLKITTTDGITGYITVKRIGIFISELDAGNDTFHHGAYNRFCNHNITVDSDKNRIVAAFYHEIGETYNDYDLIVNILYDDGTSETKIAKGVKDVTDESGQLIGSDYILLTENTNSKKAIKIDVTAVKKDAILNETTFGGAAFGAGSGVEWVRKEGR